MNEIIDPEGHLWRNTGLDMARPYWILSISLNVLLTSSIIGMMLYARGLNRDAKEYPGDVYLSVSAMFFESAALYTISSVVYLILYSRKSPFSQVLLVIVGNAEVSLWNSLVRRVTYQVESVLRHY